MTSDDVMQELWRQRGEHTRAHGVLPTRCYLGWKQWSALRHYGNYLCPGLLCEPPTVLDLHIHHVLEADHLHVC